MRSWPHSRKVEFVFAIGWLLIVASVLTAGWTPTWTALDIPSLSPAFADMRSVQWARCSADLGFNPQVESPCDPWNRPLNYPSTWILLADALRLQREPALLTFVIGMVSAFLFCSWRILRVQPSWWTVALSFSNCTLLAVERGNNDLLVFVLLFVAAVYPRLVGALALTAATGLKLYPVLALPGFARRGCGVIAAGLGCAAMLWWLRDELPLIRAATPASNKGSYGLATLHAALQKQAEIDWPFEMFGPGLVVLTLLCFSMHRKVGRGEWFRRMSGGALHEPLLHIGACIYLGTFVITTNWDYRLVFLLFCVPGLLTLRHPVVRFAALGMVLCAANQRPLLHGLGLDGFYLNLASKVGVFVLRGAVELERASAMLTGWRRVGPAAANAPSA